MRARALHILLCLKVRHFDLLWGLKSATPVTHSLRQKHFAQVKIPRGLFVKSKRIECRDSGEINFIFTQKSPRPEPLFSTCLNNDNSGKCYFRLVTFHVNKCSTWNKTVPI